MKTLRVLAFVAFSFFTGTAGAQTPVLNVNPILIDFGTLDVGTSKTQVVTLSNLTAAPLPITGFSASGDGSFSIDVNAGSQPCDSENPTIGADDFCTMAVTFAPTFAVSASGGVSFTPDNDPDLSVNARFLGEAIDPDTGGCSLSISRPRAEGFWLRMLRAAEYKY